MDSYCWFVLGICIGVVFTVFCLIPSFIADTKASEQRNNELIDKNNKLLNDNNKLKKRIKEYKRYI